MENIKYKRTDGTFDTALAFLECRAREAGLKDFTLGQAFTYNETQQTDTDGYITETVLFDHLASGRTIGIEVDSGPDCVTSVWVSDRNGGWIDDGTDADKIRQDPKAWFTKTLLPKKYTATATVHFSFDVECEAYDLEEANELLEQAAYENYLTAKTNGVDASVEGIKEV